jgi:hypothetical protein
LSAPHAAAAALVLLLIPAGARAARAQSAWLVSGRLALVEQRVDAGFGVERFAGVGLGLDVERRLGSRFTVGLRGQGATVRPDDSGDLDRRIGEAELGAAMALKPWWGVYGSVMRRAIANDAGSQQWTLVRIGAELRPAFSGGRLHALGRLGAIPVTSVSGLSQSSLAFDGLVGVEYEHPRYALRLAYGLERFAFTSENGNRRDEQMSTLTVRVGVRLQR